MSRIPPSEDILTSFLTLFFLTRKTLCSLTWRSPSPMATSSLTSPTSGTPSTAWLTGWVTSSSTLYRYIYIFLTRLAASSSTSRRTWLWTLLRKPWPTTCQPCSVRRTSSTPRRSTPGESAHTSSRTPRRSGGSFLIMEQEVTVEIIRWNVKCI